MSLESSGSATKGRRTRSGSGGGLCSQDQTPASCVFSVEAEEERDRSTWLGKVSNTAASDEAANLLRLVGQDTRARRALKLVKMVGNQMRRLTASNKTV